MAVQTNFDFLEEEHPILANIALSAEYNIFSATNMLHSCILPMNYMSFTTNYLFTGKKRTSLIYGFILLLPLMINFLGMITFLIFTFF